ncbi:MAG: hypothetical protein JNN27_20255 [Planctomycetes bacterium]|nr:hypothetical protein [Planctomycetota bacterium]
MDVPLRNRDFERRPRRQTRWPFSSEPPLGLEAEGEYKASNPEGPRSFRHPSGQLRAQGRFVSGAVERPWIFWSDTGVVDTARSGRYAAGALVAPLSAAPTAR